MWGRLTGLIHNAVTVGWSAEAIGRGEVIVGASEKVGHNSEEGVGRSATFGNRRWEVIGASAGTIGRSEVVVGASEKAGHNSEEGVGRSAEVIGGSAGTIGRGEVTVGASEGVIGGSVAGHQLPVASNL